MRNRISALSRCLGPCALLAVVGPASAQTDIARWSFTAVEAAPYNTPPASTDLTSASATQLGMTNGYNGGNTASCDVLNVGGNPDPLGVAAGNNAWRIRGTTNNGWALAAPQYTQGAEFDVSTVGFSGILLSFDFYCTTQGIRDLQVQYNTNTANSAGWTNFQGSFAGNVATEKDTSNDTELIATSNGWNTASANVTRNTIDFTANGISGADNDANFGIRLVSAYQPGLTDGNGNPTYGGAAGGIYNNTSGNWRFDQVAIQGTPAPEPASLAAISLGVLALIRKRRK